MALTDPKVKNAKPAAKGYRLADIDGLHLFVSPAGTKSWRWRVQEKGKERLLTLGQYPAMGISEARRARETAAGGNTPKLTPTFEAVARQWHELNKPRWKPHHAADVLASLQTEVFPAFGSVPVNGVTGAMVLGALRLMEARGAVETARRVKQRCSAVFGFAASHEWTAADPTLGIKAALAPLPAKGRRPALLTLEEARGLIAAMDGATGQPVTKVALRLLALTAARPGEIAGMRWDELQGDEWHLPPERTKITVDRARLAEAHVVPLVPQAIACLDAIRPLTSASVFVFPSHVSMRKPMSENALGEMLIRLGYQGRHVPHGWRATFSSVMNERYPADRQVIDLMLAHTPKDRVEGVYNRARHSGRRRELAGLWADMLLSGGRVGGRVG